MSLHSFIRLISLFLLSLPTGSRIQAKCEFGICSLDIKGAYQEDSGIITCRVMNDAGTQETSGKLIVQGKR